MRAPVLLAAALLAAPAAALEQFSLPNGMRVVLAPDRAVPVVTVGTVFAVGARQEERGRSGFAHLFEHLMFQGSAHAPKGTFTRTIEGHGGDNNASTHQDFTFYYETVPSNALELALWLEADRLSALDISTENMRGEVEVVKEEKRMRVDDQPYAPLLWVEVSSRSFSNWANAHSTIGSFEDLEAASLADVRSFFRDRYSPSNAVMALVGDFDPAKARALVERYFGWIPARGRAAAPDASEPPQAGARRHVVEDAQARLPALAVVWRDMPARRSPDFYAMVLLGRILFDGKGSRLYQSLVKEQQAAVDVSGGLGFPTSDEDEYKEPGLFGAFILHPAAVPSERVERLFLSEVAAAASSVGEEELARAKTKFRSDWVRERQTTRGRALALLRSAVLDGDAAADEGELARFLEVDAARLRAAAARHLVPGALNVFECRPKAPPPPKAPRRPKKRSSVEDDRGLR